MRPTKKIVVSLVLVLLVVVAFWLGRVTSRERKADTASHEESPKAMKSSSEAAPHEHTGNEPPGHDEAKKKPSGLTLTADQKANIGLKTVTADLRAIENVIRVAGVVRPHPDREAQVSSRVSGKIVGLFFKAGDGIQRGQRIAEVQSAEIQKLQVDLMQAENKLTLAKAELERVQSLVESKIAARKELIAAQNNYQAVLNEIGSKKPARRRTSLRFLLWRRSVVSLLNATWCWVSRLSQARLSLRFLILRWFLLRERPLRSHFVS
ncbi:MAG: biotin/lipoyl-binding protein [Deltaproteobacteria bacterium]|nr:MAG: biotin/lipoyl-binding protein [Deltaproteobacteria bacterium]